MGKIWDEYAVNLLPKNGSKKINNKESYGNHGNVKDMINDNNNNN